MGGRRLETSSCRIPMYGCILTQGKVIVESQQHVVSNFPCQITTNGAFICAY
jgi:hypothetical protein